MNRYVLVGNYADACAVANCKKNQELENRKKGEVLNIEGDEERSALNSKIKAVSLTVQTSLITCRY